MMYNIRYTGGIKMKKAIKWFSVMFIFFLLCIGNKANAEDIILNSSFIGTIEPLRSFYNSEYPSKEDFKVSGDFYSETNETMNQQEWKLYCFNPVKENQVVLTLRHLSTLSGDEKQYSDIEITVKVKCIDFSPNLSVNIPEISTITYGTLKSKLKDLTVKAYDESGQRIYGRIKFTHKQEALGIMKISYTFIPTQYIETAYGFESFNITKGYFTLQVTPKMIPYIDKYHISIYASNFNDCEYKLGKNGKWQEERDFYNLKSKTKYTIYCRVKDKGDGKPGKTSFITVKTK